MVAEHECDYLNPRWCRNRRRGPEESVLMMANLQPLLPRKIPQSIFRPIADAPPVADLSGMTQGPNPLGTIASIAPPPLATVGLDPRAALDQKNSDDLANRASTDSADLFKRSHPTKPTSTLGKIGHVAANIGNVL